MKRISSTIFVIFLMLMLSACGVSQSDYDSEVSKNESLTAEKEALITTAESLEATIDMLNEQVKTLEEENQSINQQLLNFSDYYVESITALNYGKAWATTCFGDDSICLIDDSKTHFQCMSGRRFELTENGVADIWNTILESAKTLSVLLTTYDISYETLSIKFYDPSDTFILEAIISINDGEYQLNALSGNLLYTSTILPVFSSD